MSYEIEAIATHCQNSNIGKLLPNALYIHIYSLSSLPQLLQDYERTAKQVIPENIQYTLIKFSTDKLKISYLYYPEFDQNPHPSLAYSLVVEVATLTVKFWDYRQSNNPPILHRKETLVSCDYPLYSEFIHLTQTEEKLDLLKNSHLIGTSQQWQQRLQAHHLDFIGHYLVCHLSSKSPEKIAIERHKAAIYRKNLSLPVRIALEAELFTPETTFFDYGCGHGADVVEIQERGYSSNGWDPYYCGDLPLVKSDIVNLGYVINVIENLNERRQALLKAWELSQKILIVAAQVLIDDSAKGWLAYGDGVVTTRNTFQKYYQQEELKSYIDQVLGVDAIPVALGIYFVFRDTTQGEIFRASRFHRSLRTPRLRQPVKSYEDLKELLTPLVDFITRRGRLPIKGELSNEREVKAELGSIPKAFKLILQATDTEEWEAIAEQRREDLLLYLALSNFRVRPTFQQLSPLVKQDIKGLFGSYKQACLLADMMLITVSDLENLADIAKTSKVGYKSAQYFLIHISALDSLDVMLRLYEGCASRTFGRLETANLIRFSWKKPQITYLCAPDFDQLPHPLVTNTMTITLDTLHISYQDYQEEDNPPIIHRKDSLVESNYPNYDKFCKLTRQEEDWGVLSNLSKISRLKGWLNCLEENGANLQGYRLVWRKDLDPYRLKLLKAQVQERKRHRNSETSDFS